MKTAVLLSARFCRHQGAISMSAAPSWESGNKLLDKIYYFNWFNFQPQECIRGTYCTVGST